MYESLAIPGTPVSVDAVGDSSNVHRVKFLTRHYKGETAGMGVRHAIQPRHGLRAVPKFLAEMLARQCVGKQRDDLVFANEHGGYLRSARVHEDNMSWFAGTVKRSGQNVAA